MKHGFIKVAAVTPDIRVADTAFNAGQICGAIEKAAGEGARVIVLPELCLSAYTCGDLFLQQSLLASCQEQLLGIADFTKGIDGLVFVGLPYRHGGGLFNVAAAICGGRVLAFVPKSYIPSHGEFYEARHFTPGNKETDYVNFGGREVPFGTRILFQAREMEELVIGCEICEDLWVPQPPSVTLAGAGASLIVNLSASNETIGKDAYRELLVKSASARLLAGYVYTSAGEGESTQDLVFGGHNLIAENGIILSQAKCFENRMVTAEIDLQRLLSERRRMTTFETGKNDGYLTIPFSIRMEETVLTRKFAPLPFVPDDEKERKERCEEILSIQSYGLKKRLQHAGCERAVLGISGGLDSTLALLVTVRAFGLLGLPRRNILAVTMPCFGTTDRTYDNACKLTATLGASLREIDIREAVSVHFRDIGQNMEKHDVTYENAQARERTQILMDLANQVNGMVVGTGDMSELALGWATYNGDHMSMYGVNAGVPKTLVRHLVQYCADTCTEEALSGVLLDVLATPVSPELLPPVDGVISQKTEDLVGPYELHDFFLYYMLRWGFEPDKIYRIAREAFGGKYEDGAILKWMRTFYRRFFSQQFKRSCLPDGPKVGSVALSPRGDLRMPSDACGTLWLLQIENLKEDEDKKG